MVAEGCDGAGKKRQKKKLLLHVKSGYKITLATKRDLQQNVSFFRVGYQPTETWAKRLCKWGLAFLWSIESRKSRRGWDKCPPWNFVRIMNQPFPAKKSFEVTKLAQPSHDSHPPQPQSQIIPSTKYLFLCVNKNHHNLGGYKPMTSFSNQTRDDIS